MNNGKQPISPTMYTKFGDGADDYQPLKDGQKTGWEVTGLDWDNGKTVYRAKFGFDNYGHGAYAIVQFLPNGDLLFNSIAGPVRVTTK